VLLVTQHHIISDGWSIGVLIGEVTALYTAYSQGQPDPLPPLAIQYADYAVWQRQWLQGEALQAQLGFWREHLAGAPALLELPTDRPRPAVQSYAGGSVSFTLPLSLVNGLRALSQRHGTTLYMTLLSGWAVLMSRLSGQDEVVIGMPVANRQRAEVEPLIGFFVNMLALRVSPGEVQDTAGLLAQVRTRALAAFSHQVLPFDLMVEAVNPARSMSHSPIFQTIVSMNNASRGGPLQLPGVQLEPLEVSTHTAQFELALTLTDTSDGVVGNLSYARSLFERDSVERLAGYLRELLEGMVADDTAALRQLPLLPADAIRALAEQGRGACLETTGPLAHALFEQHAARTPEATALVVAGQSCSYGELNQRANRLAHFLLGLGVRPETRVGICCTRGVEMVVAMLAVLKAGAAYVPLNPDYPAEQLSFVLEDSAALVLLADTASEDKLPAMSLLQTVIVDADDAARIARCPDSNPASSASALSHLAYVIYTSGSTGRPNGVAVEQGNLRHYLRWAQSAYAADGRIDAVVSSPFAFDATITSLYLPLVTGGKAVLLAQGTELAELPGQLLRCAPGTLCKITPAHLAALCDQLRALGTACPPHLFVVGGEALPAATVTALQAVTPGARVINEYGPTETVVGCVVQEADGSRQADGTVPIGRPIANTAIYVLDAQRQMQPVGVVGEIHIGGAGVARGYLNRPELTAARFITDPFHTDPSARLYRTGDLGRWRADGTLEYLGRNDFQVKIRGFRVELGEIEAKLAGCDGVREAVVLARADAPGEKRLVAYVIAQDGAELSAATLRETLAKLLPEYMVPSAYVPLDAWPLTTNGKLDRRALPSTDAQAFAAPTFEPPESDVEVIVAKIWRDLFGLDRLGRNDHFFELGGHSLMAITLIGRLRQYGLSAEVRDIFSSPTLASFCAALS
ncbi:MAG: amino acid adenylation domain-containing protein, partial [Ramlibacter sp.]|nr:amino acid adenylation domain-containing protein [Ramlibacter sp.]